ncbi:hypothetical protein DB30_06866 [Enhygromyxa salina]|uniref:FG-GAP repeat protein n=1 Tax=Enhygromyxa salina TaxID=215803 RepID=A0A0C2CT97_9BACT|nr:hypothetical protein [Enhygromyxa salina]KIG14391.1 hypothetical protein DB30_06866 [Enhygromyxa salina]
MDAKLDPRIWNIVVGVGLVAGCGARTIGQDGSAGDTLDTGETDDTDDTDDTGPECVSNSDCETGYTCEAGVCNYWGYDDGHHPYYECYFDQDCGAFELCSVSNYCESLGAPPPPCAPELTIGATQIPLVGSALALQFVDLDADGDDELVVATQDEFHVFHDLEGPAITSARSPTSPAIESMIAGAFDPQPGSDLMLLVDEQLWRHGSNGADGFVAATIEDSPITGTTGLLSGNFDATGLPDDLLIWGPGGAFVDQSSGVPIALILTEVLAAAVLDRDAPTGGYALRGPQDQSLFGIDEGPLVTTLFDAGEPKLIVSVSSSTDARFLSLQHYSSSSEWSLVRHSTTAGLLTETTIPATPVRAIAADLDGDSSGDVVYLSSPAAQVGVHVDPLGPGSCWLTVATPLTQVAGAAAGDLDGDGDDEVAVQLSDGSVVVLREL